MYNIGKLKFDSKVFLAPMAAVNNSAFRFQCHNYGAGIVWSALIDEDGFKAKPEKFDDFITEERPVVAQLVGSNPDKMADAAKILSKKVDMIDINCGCPEASALQKKAGAYLVKHPGKVEDIVNSVKSAVKIPVCAKTRIGWDPQTINHVKVAKLIEKGGADVIAVHGRTKTQGYSGKANWSAIKQVKDKVGIPVIGNGDVVDAESAEKLLEFTGCDFIMIGRAAMGNPFIFKQCNEYLENGVMVSDPSKKERIEAFLEFLGLYDKYCGRDRFPEIRQQAMWYMQHFAGSKELREKVAKIEDRNSLCAFLDKQIA